MSYRQQAHFVSLGDFVVFNWYILVKEGAGISVQQCVDEQTAKATVIALFRENRELIEAGRLRGPAYLVIKGAELRRWANGCGGQDASTAQHLESKPGPISQPREELSC
jgi:hypothetical protein